MKNRCKFGLELPYNTIDPFFNRTDQFFSLCQVPEGTVIPCSPYGLETVAERVKAPRDNQIEEIETGTQTQ